MYMFILCSFFIPYVIYTAMKLWLCKAHGMCAPVYVNQSKSEQHNKVVLYRYMLATLRKLYMLYAVGVSTPILQRGNLMCSMLCVWAHPYFRGETLCAVHCGCGVSHTLVKKQPCFQTCQMFWVWPHPCYLVKCLSALAFYIKQSQFPLFANGNILREDLYTICLKLNHKVLRTFFP